MVERIHAFFTNNKKLLLLFLLVLGVILIFFSSSPDKKESTVVKEKTLEDYRVEIESELKELCESVEGVGHAVVYVTLERGQTHTYKGTVLIDVKPPRVLGVSVVCEGGGSDIVRKALTDMLSSLFAIGSNRISILKLNS